MNPDIQKQQALEQRRQEITFASQVNVAPVGYQPMDMESLVRLSQLVCRSGLAPQAVRGDAGSVAMLIALGHTMGLSWAQAIQELQIINGKVSCSAVLLHARCEKSPECEFFTVTEATDERATVTVKRREWSEPQTLTYSIQDAQKQGLLSRGGAWKSVPRAMLVARARAEAARRWFPGIVVGFYATEEMEASSQIPVSAGSSPAEKLVSAAKSAAAHMALPEEVEVEVVEPPRKVVVKGKMAEVVSQLEEMAEEPQS